MADYLGDDTQDDEATGPGQTLASRAENDVPEALRAASMRATELVGESSLSREERDRVLAFREAPYLERLKERTKNLTQSMEAQGLRWSGDRARDMMKEQRLTEDQLAERIYVPMLQQENQLDLQRTQLAQGVGESMARVQQAGRAQTLAEREQGAASAIRERAQTLAEREQGAASAIRERGQTLAEREQGAASAIRERGQTLAEREQGAASAIRERGQTLAETESAARATGVYNGQETLAGREQREASDVRERGQSLSELEQSESSRIRSLGQQLDTQVQLGRLSVEEAQQQLQAEIERGQLGLEERRTTLAERVDSGELTISERKQALSELEQSEASRIRSLEQQLNQQVQTGQLTLAEANFYLDTEIKRGQLSLEERRTTLAERTGESQMTIAERQQDLQEKVQTGQLSLAEADLEQRRIEFDQQLDVQLDDMAQQYGLSRDELDLERRRFESGYALDNRKLEEDIRQYDLDRSQHITEFREQASIERGRLALQGQSTDIEAGRLELDRQGQDTQAALERARLSGELVDPETGQSVETLEARTQAIQNQLAVADRTGQFVKKANASDFGIDTSSYLDADGNVTDLGAYFEAADILGDNFRAVYGREMMPTEAQQLIKGRQVPVRMGTMAADAQGFEQAIEAADRTGTIVDPLTGWTVTTVQAQAKRDATDLERQGLQQEADRLQETSEQFDAELRQRIKEQAQQFGLDEKMTQAQIANVYAGIEQNKAQLEQKATEFFATNQRLMTELLGTSAGSSKVTAEALGVNLGLSGVSSSDLENMIGEAFRTQMGRDPTGEETYSLMRGWDVSVSGSPTLAARQLAAQVSSDHMQMAVETSRIAKEHDLDVRKFEASMDQWDQDFALEAKEVSHRYQMDYQKFSLASQDLNVRKAQIEEDQAQGRISLKQAQQQINNARTESANRYHLDTEKFNEVSRQFDEKMDQATTVAVRSHLMDVKRFNEAKRQYDIQESRNSLVFQGMTESFRKNTSGGRNAGNWFFDLSTNYGETGRRQAEMIMSLINGSQFNFAQSDSGRAWESVGRVGTQLAFAAI